MTEKLTPLPWFAFNVGEYVKDTMRLTRDAHGAYLLLMLDYYGTGTPCPDDDFILAAVTKSTEEEWVKLRRALAPFFDIREGHWHHNRIEREMRDASAAHAARIAAVTTASNARWGKAKDGTQETGKNKPKRARKSVKDTVTDASRNPSRIPDAIREPSVDDPHKQEHPSITEGGGEPPDPEDGADALGSPIPLDLVPEVRTIERAREAGLSVEEIDAEVRKFIGSNRASGAWSHDWQGSLAVWIEREIAHRAKAAKSAPRIVVDSNQPHEPTEADWMKALGRFAKNNSLWSRSLGPEPGQLGCKCPPELIERAGLDPKTGLKRRVA